MAKLEKQCSESLNESKHNPLCGLSKAPSTAAPALCPPTQGQHSAPEPPALGHGLPGLTYINTVP